MPPSASTPLPPAMALAYSEFARRKYSLESLDRLLSDKSFARDARQQARHTLNDHPYPRPAATLSKLTFCPTSSLNPLSHVEQCLNPSCRTNTAMMLARSLGLYADSIVINDWLSYHLTGLGDGPYQDLVQAQVRCDLAALASLMPLVRGGIITFEHPTLFRCPQCEKSIVLSVEPAAKEEWKRLATIGRVGFTTRRGETVLEVRDPTSTLVPAFEVSPSRAKALRSIKANRGAAAFRKAALDEVRERMIGGLKGDMRAVNFEVRAAAEHRAILASQSLQDIYSIRTLAGRSIEALSVRELGHLQRIQLPWLSDLDAEGILHVRQMAAKALPAFRARLAKSLFVQGDNRQPSENQTKATIAELRGEVESTVVELRALKKRSHIIPALSYGAGAIGMIIAGFGSDNLSPIAAAASFSGVLAGLHVAHSNARADKEKLVSSPGYVLLQARNWGQRHRAAGHFEG